MTEPGELEPGNFAGRPAREHPRAAARARAFAVTLTACAAIAGCAASGPTPVPHEMAALALLPLGQAGITDGRGRYREIFCGVLAARGPAGLPVRDCDEALLRLAAEPAGTGAPVDLSRSTGGLDVFFVPGLASDCVGQAAAVEAELKQGLDRAGYRLWAVPVNGLSGSVTNASRIRDVVVSPGRAGPPRKAVVVGHSKGVVDTLEALARFPELHGRIVAVVSLAGAVGGSPLADRAPAALLELAARTPGLECKESQRDALVDLSPAVRQLWLARNRLPSDVRFYSIVALPMPDRVSSGLQVPYRLLGRIDRRNDGNLIFYDQVVPGSTLLAYANADHWAVMTDLAASANPLVRSLADRNDFPRLAMLEAALRFIEESLRPAADANGLPCLPGSTPEGMPS